MGQVVYEIVVPIVPMGKPRMTQRDKWSKRPPVEKYRAWGDDLRMGVLDGMKEYGKGSIDTRRILEAAHGLSWEAFFPIPAATSKKRAAEMAGTIHRKKPDRDNVDKAILDCLMDEDSGIGTGTLTKRWDDGSGPRIILKIQVYE